MYMLARHVLGSRFFLMPADVQLMPEYYQDYHAGRIEAIREDPKRLCYDEAHRVTNNVSVAGQLQADMTTMARESRKWNLSIGLYTQSIDDIPKIITDELATTVVILGSGTEKSIDNLSERFGLNGACRHALSRLGKPGKAGSNLIALFRTGSGMSQLVLSLTIGPQSLWAFSTTTEDVAIRNNLYQRLGRPKPAAAGRSFSGRFGQGRSGTPQAQCRRPERRRWGSRQRHSGNCQRNSEGTMKKVLLALLITVFPAQVWAGGCGCGSVRAIVTAAKSETIQAVNAYTATEAQAIRSEILLAAQNIIGTIKTESATIVAGAGRTQGKQCRHAQGAGCGGEAMKTEDMYGKARATRRAVRKQFSGRGHPARRSGRAGNPCRHARKAA